MTHSTRSRDRQLLLMLAVGVVAAMAVVFAAAPLPRLTPDSASYLTGAEQLVESGRFASCDGLITLFAPGYSAALTPFVALGLDAPDSARLVNALATLALVLGAGFLGRATGLGRRASLIVAIAVAVSYATLRNGALVWSEPLFCAISAWLLVLAVGRGGGLDARLSARLVAVVLLSWALLMTRHSGAFLLPAIVLATWLGSSALPFRTARVAALSVALVAGPALWWSRNVEIDGDPFGRRSESRFRSLEILEQLLDGVSSIALPTALPDALRLIVAVPLIVAAALAWRRSAANPQLRAGVAVLSTSVVSYVAAVAVAATRTVVDPLDTRLMSPILVPAAVLVALGVCARRTRLERVLCGFALVVVGAMAVIAPGVVWRSHEAERTLDTIPDDVSCADWPTRYSAVAVRLTPDRR